MKEENLIGTSEAARLLGIGQTRVHQLAEAGQLPVALRTPLGRLYRRRDVEALAAERAARGVRPFGRPRVEAVTA